MTEIKFFVVVVFVFVRYDRILEWLRLEGILNSIQSHSLCCGQGCYPLDQSAQGPIQSGSRDGASTTSTSHTPLGWLKCDQVWWCGKGDVNFAEEK